MREGTAGLTELAERGRYDLKLPLAALALVAVGLVMIASAAQMVRLNGVSGPHFYFFTRQLVIAGLGLLGLAVIARIPYRLYQRFALHILVAAFLLLVAVLFVGSEVRGSRRIIRIAWFDFQPVETAKIALVVFLAAKIGEWGDRITDLARGVLPLLAVGLAMAGLVALQPNLSNAVLIVAMTFLMLFIAGARIKHLALCGAGLAVAAAPLLLRFPKFVHRLHDFLNGNTISFQLDQSLIALGSGGVLGFGPGRGHQKFRFLPDAHTDFIYSIIGEELGLIGTVAVLLVFVYILRRAVRTARRSPDSFGYLLALGSGMLLFFSAVINMAMTTGVVPVAGLPLPFISYGGSSLVASLAVIGILVNISYEGKERSFPVELFGLRRRPRVSYARRR